MPHEPPSPHRAAYQQAAEHAVDDHLLPFENPDAADPGDIRMWVSVYEELLGVKHQLLATARAAAEKLTAAVAREEIASTDLLVLEAERKRFQSRLDFWRGRAAECGVGLGGAPVDDGGRRSADR